jgi:hypothetical protein
MMRFAGPVLGCLLLMFAPLPAHAQIDAFAGPLSPGNWMSTFNMDPVSQVVEQERRKSATRAASTGPAVSPDRAASLRFVASPERRRKNLASFLKKARAVDPAGADQLGALFASGDIISRIQGELAKVGLRTDNLADAYALWWINCWSAVHGDLSTPDRSTIDAVKGQAARALVAGGRTAGIPDAVKQEFAEAMLIQALLLDGSLQQAKGNAAQLRLLAAAANTGARGMGLDMTTMRLTSTGFVPKG